MIIKSLKPHEETGIGRSIIDRELRPEGDRHLAKQVALATLSYDALDPVDQLDRLNPTFEHGEERALAALVRRVLTRHEADIRRCPGKPFALGRTERGKDADPTDLVRSHHDRHSRRQAGSAGRRATCRAEKAGAQSRPTRATTPTTLLRHIRPRTSPVARGYSAHNRRSERPTRRGDACLADRQRIGEGRVDCKRSAST